jgi:DegV family protein with EDD domain
MTIAIVTDSTCDLSPQTARELNITVMPLHIHFGEQDFLDGKDLSRAEFYDRLRSSDLIPKTAAPGQERFKRVCQQLLDQGAGQVLSIHIGASLSATVEVAAQAAESLPAGRVIVRDSGQISLGTGYLAEAAARAAADGEAMTEILRQLDDLQSRTHVFAALDTLEFLRRSGRMNGALAGLGSLLQIKPILKMHAGRASTEQRRTQRKAWDRMIELLDELQPFERVAMVHANAPTQAHELREMAAGILPNESIDLAEITPVIGAHVGPGAVGFACVQRARP